MVFPPLSSQSSSSLSAWRSSSNKVVIPLSRSRLLIAGISAASVLALAPAPAMAATTGSSNSGSSLVDVPTSLVGTVLDHLGVTDAVNSVTGSSFSADNGDVIFDIVKKLFGVWLALG